MKRPITRLSSILLQQKVTCTVLQSHFLFFFHCDIENGMLTYMLTAIGKFGGIFAASPCWSGIMLGMQLHDLFSNAVSK